MAAQLAGGASALVALVLLCVPASALAIDIGVTPAVIDAQVTPGAAGRVSLTVTNYDQTPLVMHAYAWDYGVGPVDAKTGDSTVSWYPPGTQAHGAGTWLAVIPDEFTVQPQSSEALSIVVSPPADAVGGRYAMVFLEDGPKPDPEGGSAALLAGRLGVKVLLRVGTDGTRDLELRDLTVRPATDTLPLRVDLRLENTGSLHVVPVAKGVLRAADGSIAGRLEGESSWAFLPGQIGHLELIYPAGLPPGSYQLAGTVTYGSDEVIVLDHTFTIAEPAPEDPSDVTPGPAAEPRRRRKAAAPAPAP